MDWTTLGTVGRQIEVVPYAPEWPGLFEFEARRIQEACGDTIVVVEHIGSTAVPGLLAKPILDMMPGLRSYQDGFKTIEPLKQLGYEYFGENGIPGRHYFNLVYEQRTILHVHMIEMGTEFWQRHLLFRDYLRAHPTVAAQYAQLKKELAVRYRNERTAYTEGKSEFINSVLQKARLTRQAS